MWNIPRSIGQMGPVMVPLKTQKRDFASINLSSVAIAPGKSFRNPNFVNNHPNVHCCYNSAPISVPVQKVCQNSDSDTSGVVTKLCTDNNINSSQNTVDKSAKEIYCESPIRKSPVGRKRCKKVRKSRKKKVPHKKNICRQQINDMMDIDLEPEVSMNCVDGNMSTISISPKTLHLTDFIVDIPTKMNDELFTVISISPPCNNRNSPRERELSICESEDSFIVFDSGTDEELKFSDSDNTELDTDDDDTDSDIDDDFDSSCSVLPCKRVRFAEKEDLCEVHPMVQWSYAYRNARKGPWEEYARDRERFSKRIKHTESILGPIFDQRHRENVYRERFDENP